MADAAIVAEGLGRRFGPVRALDGVNLELPGGAVVGPNAIALYRHATST